MKITRYRLFLDGFEVLAEIGIHDFERGIRQRITIRIELEIDPKLLPRHDDITEAMDYDGIRDDVRTLVERQRFDLQETLARGIVEIAARRPQVIAVTVQTAKPDVYADVAAVGCRLEAKR